MLGSWTLTGSGSTGADFISRSVRIEPGSVAFPSPHLPIVPIPQLSVAVVCYGKFLQRVVATAGNNRMAGLQPYQVGLLD